MNQSKIQYFLNENVSILKGVGLTTKKLLKKKKIEKIRDLIWNIPDGFTDRTNVQELNKLEIGKITTIKVIPIKYNFPRIRNLPNKVICEDNKGKIDIVFFNSREGYIRKVLSLNKEVIISGKINYFNKKYQITNPAYIVPVNREKYVNKIIPKYSLTEGLSENVYRKLINQVLEGISEVKEWHSKEILKKIGNISWSKCVYKIHNDKKNDINSDFYRRLAYDEILANLLVLSASRKRIKKIKKIKKVFDQFISKKIINNFKFTLTKDQIHVLNEINKDIKSENKMFRLLQGDVGSGKTIVSFLAAGNVIRSKFQVALMAPTEILAKQHYDLALKIFKYSNIKIDFLSGKFDLRKKNEIKENLINGKIDLIIGTHALFQKSIFFKNLGLVIIDEQHKFGVRQRIELSDKGGKNCDILLMSATPIPRTLVLAFYGDMDVSRIIEKPSNRKDILTLSKPEEKRDEILEFVKKQIHNKNQIFWVCPLIEESKTFDYSAAKDKFIYLSEIFKNKVGLIHGGLNKDEKDQVLNDFLNNSISILVSTTVIEVGIDFPNANTIVIENSNKFGLSQLHQLRGRVGRGNTKSTCILLYKKNLSINARKRIKVLKKSNDGFFIAEEDMKLRGFGDVLGYQQSGLKNFKLADPIHHSDLFDIAEENIRKIELDNMHFTKYNFILKLFDKADIINQINLNMINRD
jgi:ATP-dependent DNA helicase RecG